MWVEGHEVTCSVNVMAVQERQKKQCNDPFSLLVLSSPGVRRLPEPDQRTGANVHYTLLIACVLVAFFLGAILSGLLVSCYCSGSAAQRARRLGKEPEAPLPHALSLRSLAKLNGLLDAQPKVIGEGAQDFV